MALLNVAQSQIILGVVLFRCLVKHLPDGLNSAFGRDDFHSRPVREHEGIELEVEDDLALEEHAAVFLIALKYHL